MGGGERRSVSVGSFSLRKRQKKADKCIQKEYVTQFPAGSFAVDNWNPPTGQKPVSQPIVCCLHRVGLYDIRPIASRVATGIAVVMLHPAVQKYAAKQPDDLRTLVPYTRITDRHDHVPKHPPVGLPFTLTSPTPPTRPVAEPFSRFVLDADGAPAPAPASLLLFWRLRPSNPAPAARSPPVPPAPARLPSSSFAAVWSPSRPNTKSSYVPRVLLVRFLLSSYWVRALVHTTHAARFSALATLSSSAAALNCDA